MATKYKIFVQPQGEGQPKLYGRCETDMELDHEMRKIGSHYSTINPKEGGSGKYWCKFTVKQVA